LLAFPDPVLNKLVEGLGITAVGFHEGLSSNRSCPEAPVSTDAILEHEQLSSWYSIPFV